MMATHLTTLTRLIILTALTTCILILPPNENAKGRRASRPRQAATPATATIRIAVLPFRNSLARQSSVVDDASVLGDGVADSLTNALKSVPGLSVLDSEVVLRVAANFPDHEIGVRDEDALRVAESLNAKIVVAGSFQMSRDHLHVDARLLTADPSVQVPARLMMADCSYPDNYSALLNSLLRSILTNLKVPLSRLSAVGTPDELAGTHSPQAYQWFARGIRLAHEGDGKAESLTQAVEFFDKALAVDPNFSPALAERSQAKERLCKIKEKQGESDGGLCQAAMNDAQGAVKASRGSGRSYHALAGAQMGVGDYQSAARSSRLAAQSWPGDAESLLDVIKALGNGNLVRSDETDRLLIERPDLALLLPELPKVLAVNESEYPLTVSFIPAQGKPYPLVGVGRGASRVIALFPGYYRIVFESLAGSIERQETFEAGRDYKVVFSADAIPVGAFTFVNAGNYSLQIRLTGPRSASLVLRPGETRRVPMPPGSYSVTARVLTAVTTGEHELSAGREETITYTYSGGRVPIFSPSKLTILNDGNSTLTATIEGPRRLSVRVPPGGKTIMLPAGNYTVRVACGGDVSDAGEFTLRPDAEAVVDGYGCTIRYVYR